MELLLIMKLVNFSMENINTSDTQYTLTDVPPSSPVSITVRAYTVIGPGNISVATTNAMAVRKCITKVL